MEQARSAMIRHIQQNGGDAGTLLTRLNDHKVKDPRWDYACHVEQGRLTRLWWMTPYQQLVAKFFGSVLLVDTSEGKNAYDYHLTTFVVLDGNYKNRNIAYCVHAYKDIPTYTWMFEHAKKILKKWQKPEAVWSDRDKGIEGAMAQVWSSVFHGVCLWHLYDNLRANLLGVLSGGFNAFMVDFWETYRMGSPLAFDAAWAKLLNTHSAARNYLSEHIYPDKHKWAWAYVGNRFVGGTRTTGRVESEHKVFKSKGMNRRFPLAESSD